MGMVDKATIKVRQLQIAFKSGTPRHWVSGNPVLTNFLNALSLTFPPGESFFCDSVRAFAGKISAPELKKAIRAFLTQEGLHSKHHHDFNAWLASLGLPGEALTQKIADELRQLQSQRGELYCLATTCALEHLTAVFAEFLLKNPEVLQKFADEVRPLWIWHAIEELEHKAVAFDVYREVGGGNLMRYIALIEATLRFSNNIIRLQHQLMQHAESKANWSQRAEAWQFFLGPKGFLASIARPYGRYFRADFHPNDIDTQSLIDLWERRINYQVSANTHPAKQSV